MYKQLGMAALAGAAAYGMGAPRGRRAASRACMIPRDASRVWGLGTLSRRWNKDIREGRDPWVEFQKRLDRDTGGADSGSKIFRGGWPMADKLEDQMKFMIYLLNRGIPRDGESTPVRGTEYNCMYPTENAIYRKYGQGYDALEAVWVRIHEGEDLAVIEENRRFDLEFGQYY